MKICPVCKRRYDDDVVKCVDDNEELVDLPKELSVNPKLPQPVVASPADRTSMIDLEAIEAKRAEKKKAQAPDGAPVEGEDADKTPPPESPIEKDRDATGTLQRSGRRGKNKAPTEVEIEAGDDAIVDEDGDIPADRRVNEDPTDREMSRGVRSRKSTQKDKSGVDKSRTGMSRADKTRATQLREEVQKRRLSGAQAAVLVVIGVTALIAGIVGVARATAVLTVTTVPPGALVSLDSVSIGTSPIQKRVRTGSHEVLLTLDGYEQYQEVVDVPAGGLPFLQPLQRKPPPPPPPPSAAQIAFVIFGTADQMFQAGDIDGAKKKLDEALTVAPQCAECPALMVKVDAAIKKREDAKNNAEAVAAREAKLREAHALADEGRRLYEQNQLGVAKQKLYASLKLDPDNAEPHRVLSRIFNREDDVEKVRYHLQRYLELGGADGDFKVREWLRAHPK